MGCRLDANVNALSRKQRTKFGLKCCGRDATEMLLLLDYFFSLPLFFSVRSFCFVSFEKNNIIFFAITRLPSHSRLHRKLQSNRTTIAVLISSVWQSDSRSMAGQRNRIEFVCRWDCCHISRFERFSISFFPSFRTSEPQ